MRRFEVHIDGLELGKGFFADAYPVDEFVRRKIWSCWFIRSSICKGFQVETVVVRIEDTFSFTEICSFDKFI